MTTTVIAVVLALGYGLLAVAKIVPVPAMRERADGLGFSAGSFRAIGVLELAGAAGLLVGLAWALAGYMAGFGLVALMCGAVVSYVLSDAPLVAAAPAVVFAAGTVAYLIVLGGTR